METEIKDLIRHYQNRFDNLADLYTQNYQNYEVISAQMNLINNVITDLTKLVS